VCVCVRGCNQNSEGPLPYSQ